MNEEQGAEGTASRGPQDSSAGHTSRPKRDALKWALGVPRRIGSIVGFFGGLAGGISALVTLPDHFAHEHVEMSVTGPDVRVALMAGDPTPADQDERAMKISVKCTLANTGNRAARIVDARFVFGFAEDETPLPFKGQDIQAGQTAVCDFERTITIKEAFAVGVPYDQPIVDGGVLPSRSTPMQLLVKTISGTGKVRRAQIGLGTISFLGTRYNGWGLNPTASVDLMPSDDKEVSSFWTLHGF